MKEFIKKSIMKSIKRKENLLQNEQTLNNIESTAKLICEAYKTGKKVYICGNGGSAADAQHFAAELVGRYLINREALPAVAFTTDTSILTAIGNDFGYDEVFKRQVEAFVKEKDIFIGISTSGNSKNVELAMIEAKKRGAKIVGLLGKDGGKCKELCDYPIIIETNRTPNIQESHIMIIHIICEIVENELYGK